MKFEKGKKVRVVSLEGWEKRYNVEVGDVGTIHDNGKDIGVKSDKWATGGFVYFSETQLEVLDKHTKEIEDKPQRYKSREVHGMDVIDLVNHWGLNFQEANILKYLLRDKGEDESDLEKIIDYAQRELKRLRNCK